MAPILLSTVTIISYLLIWWIEIRCSPSLHLSLGRCRLRSGRGLYLDGLLGGRRRLQHGNRAARTHLHLRKKKQAKKLLIVPVQAWVRKDLQDSKMHLSGSFFFLGKIRQKRKFFSFYFLTCCWRGIWWCCELWGGGGVRMWAWGEWVRGGCDVIPAPAARRGLVWARPMDCPGGRERAEPDEETTPPLCLGGLLILSGIACR